MVLLALGIFDCVSRISFKASTCEAGKYDHVLNYWLGREGLELKKIKDGYRFTSEYNDSYLAWDKSINKFISYYGPEKRKDILDLNDENSTTSQTSTEKGEVLRQAFQ